MQYVKEEDVKFIRLSFCDVYGNQMNTSIMPAELSDAFDGAVWLDAARVGVKSHVPYGRLYLRPDPSTLSVLPWRPDHGRVMRMFCSLEDCDGNVFSADTRTLLIDTIKKAKERGCDFTFSSRAQFYLFPATKTAHRQTFRMTPRDIWILLLKTGVRTCGARFACRLSKWE